MASRSPELAAARRQQRGPVTSGSEDEGEEEADIEQDDEKPYIPSPVRRVRPTQSRIADDGKLKVASAKGIGANSPRATLVVAPMTLLSQWCDELERASGGEMNVLLYYGNSRSSIQEEISDNGVDVVVTSYGTLVSDFKLSGGGAEENVEEKTKGKAKPKPKVKTRRKGLFSVDWFRVVLDEAHLIKSRTTQNAKACYALQASRRWCLTGTPIVNRLEDLYSLLHFIRLEPWGNHSFFRTFITVPFEKKDPSAIEIIQVILESILLRREKKMKDRDGNPIVALPAKHISVVNLSFTAPELKIYDRLYANAKSKFLGYVATGQVSQNVTAIFSILMRLRQAVLHPSLVMKRLVENLAKSKLNGRSAGDLANDADDRAIQKLIEAYCNMPYKGEATDKSPALKELLDGEDLEDLVQCPICQDAVETPVFLPCAHSSCKECMLSHFAALEEKGEEPRCPVCKKGPLSAEDLLNAPQGVKPGQALTVPSKKKPAYTSSHVDSSGPGSSSQPEVITILDSSDEEDIPPSPVKKAAVPPANGRKPKIPIQPKSNGKGKAKAGSEDGDDDYVEEDVKMGDVSASEDDEEVKPPLSSPEVEKNFDLQREYTPSTKLTALIDSLKKIREADPTVKAVVFSQFTGFLDVIEAAFNYERFNYTRLDGSMSQQHRKKVVHKFKKSTKSMVLLASLKAGGVGLNLVVATHVYLMDAWWNSSIESQAIDRIHRFGQTREVYVTRFLITPSIDDKMIAIQERKKKIINGALGNKGEDGKSTVAEDLMLIFED